MTFFVRYLEQDRLGLDAQRRFDAVRAAQAAVAERLAGLTPGPALVLVADRLAGVDAASQYRYLRAVDAFEAEWRRALAPAVMSYRGLREEDVRAVRDLEFRPGPAPAHGKPTAVLLALGATAALLLGGALLQRRAAAAG